jgi:phosphoglycerate dehydrogenase-like enzyme
MTDPPDSRDSKDVPAEILVTWLDFRLDDPETGSLLRDAGLEIRHEPKVGGRTCTEVARLVANAVGAIVSTDPFDHSVFQAAPGLRVIARVGVGTDSIDLAAATEAGVAVTTTPGANSQTAADHTVAMMLATIRRIVQNDASVRRGDWSRAGDLTPWDLHSKTVGIVGLGQIGRAVATRLKGFGTSILGCDPAVATTDGVEIVELDELLARSHVVSLHAPLTESTRDMIGERQIASMRPDSILINTARGALVDEDALVRALVNGRIRAAALDVFSDEPPRSTPLLALSNVVLSPHIAGLSDGSIAVMVRQATRNLLDVLEGRPNNAVINPAALEQAKHRMDGGRTRRDSTTTIPPLGR